MARDWIKMRTDLYRDPKVSAIANHLMDPDSDLSRSVNQMNQCDMSVTRNVTRNAVVGALVTAWGVTRHQCKRIGDDAILIDTPLMAIDDIVDLPGFGEALESVGWVKIDGNSLRFPRFFEVHNADPADDQKAKNRERQRRYRERKSNVTRDVSVTSQSNARERAEREKENISLSKDKEKRGKHAARPSIEEVREYCQERGNGIDADHFIDHYTANGWRQSNGNLIRDWKAAVRTWEKRSFQVAGSSKKEIF